MICPKCKLNDLKEVVLFTSVEKHCAYCDDIFKVDTTSKAFTITLPSHGNYKVTMIGGGGSGASGGNGGNGTNGSIGIRAIDTSDPISVCLSLDSVKKEMGKYALLLSEYTYTYTKWICDGENWWEL